MNALDRLPGFRRSPHGLEWALWKRLPAILFLGTVSPIGVALALWWAAPGQPTVAEERDLMLQTYQLIGLVLRSSSQGLSSERRAAPTSPPWHLKLRQRKVHRASQHPLAAKSTSGHAGCQPLRRLAGGLRIPWSVPIGM